METIDDYILAHSEAEPKYLAQLNRASYVRLINGRMVSGHLQGRTLKIFTQMVKPKRVLELGTFAGYSALCFAEGMDEEGLVDTIEIDDELEDFIREQLAKTPYGERIRLHIGNAIEIIPQLNEVYDLVFIDADKRIYREYYELILPKVRKGGLILADNTLWDGKVLKEHARNDYQTKGIKEFNDFIATDGRVEKVILPLRDGITMMIKK